MAQQICSQCGYEGRGKRVSGRKGGGAARMLGILTMLPFHSLWSLVGGKTGKQCPHCNLPTMVKRSSNAGRLAQRRMDIELGLVTPKAELKKEDKANYDNSFGNDRSGEPNITKKPVNPEEW